MSLFICSQCGHRDFALVPQPGFDGDIVIKVNPAGDVMIRASFSNGQVREFIADRAFVNQFGICTQCKGKHCWEYDY